MAESWIIKRPNNREETHPGPVEFGDGILKLMEMVEADPPYARTRNSYAPMAWEWAERKPESV